MREFPGGPVVRTLHFHCRGHGFKKKNYIYIYIYIYMQVNILPYVFFLYVFIFILCSLYMPFNCWAPPLCWCDLAFNRLLNFRKSMLTVYDMISNSRGSILSQHHRVYNLRVLTRDFYLILCTLHFLLNFYQSLRFL